MAADERPIIETFAFEAGRRLAKKYIVNEKLGAGWEGEVYHVSELGTGIERAAKFFFPHRNPNNRAMMSYARKLNKLRDCGILIRYHTQETCRVQGQTITFLVSEYVEGELLSDMLARQRGKRLQPFEAMHLLHTLASGVEEIHDAGEYHGDLHPYNIIVNRVGLGFDLKLVDMYHWGRRTADCVQFDITQMVRIFYEAIGGSRHYRTMPPEAKAICRGMKTSLILKRFRTVRHLREHLETLSWS